MAYKPKILAPAEGGTGTAATGTSGKVLIGSGTAFVESTPTFPNASATSGKIIKSDGTNWTASTETYAAPGTSGNVLTSDGTNWTSATPSAGNGYTFRLNTNTSLSALADATTYFLGQSLQMDTSTASGVASQKIYIPHSGTITKVYGATMNTGTLGSNNNSTIAIRLNNSSDTTVSSTVRTDAASSAFSNAGLSIAVSAGDYIEFKFTGATWATNPGAVSVSLSVYIV